MRYKILNEEYGLSLIERLIKVRGIAEQDYEGFFNPNFNNSRKNPFLLNDMDKAVARIIQALKKTEKIIIFGDYDVDGITASFCLYEFITKFLKYDKTKISILYPDRKEDGYGMKKKHIDQMKQEWADLVITVDNGITSLEEAKYAKTINLDLIITDHHQILETVPEALAVVNPNCSEKYPFKWLCGAWVALKLIVAILEKSTFTKEVKNQIFNYFLPIVTIGSVADVVPLFDENRLLVKKGLELMNKKEVPPFLQGFIDFLKTKKEIDATMIGFQIAPRINAWGRLTTPYDSLQIFLHEWAAQIPYLEKLEEINAKRKKLQEEGIEFAEEHLNFEKKILIVANEDFHEGVIGIIAGRLTEKYHKPSVVFKIDHQKGEATASLRGPEYFSIIEMLIAHQNLVERCGGHQGAWGLTVKLDHFDELCKQLEAYCEEKIDDQNLEKELLIDTKIFPEERNQKNFERLEKFAPFGEGNPEPVFFFENIEVHNIEKIGKSWVGHMKIFGKRWEKLIQIIFRKRWDQCNVIADRVSVIGKIQKDERNGGYLIIWEELVERE